MNEEIKETQALPEASRQAARDAHTAPTWLSAQALPDEDDSVDETIRYTLDELRLA